MLLSTSEDVVGNLPMQCLVETLFYPPHFSHFRLEGIFLIFLVLGLLESALISFLFNFHYLLCNKLESVVPLEKSREAVVSTELLNITYLSTYIRDGGV
jgi:hypothetical protein